MYKCAIHCVSLCDHLIVEFEDRFALSEAEYMRTLRYLVTRKLCGNVVSNE